MGEERDSKGMTGGVREVRYEGGPGDDVGVRFDGVEGGEGVGSELEVCVKIDELGVKEGVTEEAGGGEDRVELEGLRWARRCR